MTWHATEMPNDALDPASYVGRLLNAEPVRPEPVADAAELPLWEVMEQAADRHLELAPLTQHYDRYLRAAEIEALRDWLLPEEPEPGGQNFRWGAWAARKGLRRRLTEQARIARGESPHD